MCGFGKAKFRELDSKKPFNSDNEIAFEVSADSMGILDTTVGTMDDFLKSGNTNANNKICYHKCSLEPDGTWKLEKDPFLSKYQWFVIFIRHFNCQWEIHTNNPPIFLGQWIPVQSKLELVY